MDATQDAASTPDSAIVAEPGPAQAALTVSVRGERGEVVLGNVFITVTSTSDGDAHRELRYDARRQRYVFPRLRAGDYVCSIRAAGYEPWTQDVRIEGAPAHVDARLRARVSTDPLVIPIGREWDEAEAAAAAVWAHGTAPEPANLSLETGLLIAFLRDPGILDTLSASMDELDVPADLVPYLHAQISSTWTFLVGAKAAAELVRRLAESRARLYALTRSVFRNEAVCKEVGRLDEPALHEAGLELVRSLDSVELLEILPFLMQTTHPERIPVAHFVRAAADLFGAQLPPRVARRRASPPEVPAAPGLDASASPWQPSGNGSVVLDDVATAHSPRVAALARAAAWAIRRSRGVR